MSTRKIALKALIEVTYHDKMLDYVIEKYQDKVNVKSELSGLLSGVLRHLITIDYFIEKLTEKNFKKLSNNIKNVLRLGIYEFEYTQNPDYAVINSYVEIIKKAEKSKGASGFVNAVLRNFLRKKNEIFFPKEPLLKTISIEFSHPEWMVKNWLKYYGEEATKKICQFNNIPPEVTIRANTSKVSKNQLMEIFDKNNVKYEDNCLNPLCLKLKEYGKMSDIIGFDEGLWLVQGEASSLVALILNPQKNENILDLCSAPGGKTCHIAEIMDNTGSVISVDINLKRLEKVSRNADRLGFSNIKTIVSDAIQFDSVQKFDRILIDAPCSNTGVLAKRADARYKRKPDDIKNLASLQFDILKNASKLVKKEGIIVYSTCSIEPEENIQVIEKFLEKNSNFVLEKIELPFKLNFKTMEKGYIQFLQSEHNIDGFFIAKLKCIK
ncbi:MAG: 16S rRNA (cytosine(967)-C(5))-methyltransferase RsmB [Candidatus Gastranaerophilales bacterium]|nr:16S rRNA (cytosine(967)-C(5))-methyltransferase RsmB [Candidatus Gastranaerophilales bacterium]